MRRSLLLSLAGVCLGLMSTTAIARSLEDLLFQAMQSYPTILARQSTRDAAKPI